MTELEKVIKGLESLHDRLLKAAKQDPIAMLDASMVADATILLKEQEARVLDWDEIKNYPVVYGEFKGVKNIFPLIITLDNQGRCLSWNPGINVSDEFLFLTYDEEDRKNTRCWNKMPTEEQRRAEKWE